MPVQALGQSHTGPPNPSFRSRRVMKTVTSQITDHPKLSATMTVIATLIAGTLAKLNIPWLGIAMIATLCLLQIRWKRAPTT